MKLFVLCFVLASVYTKCDANRFDEFLQEKKEIWKKVDELFESVVRGSQDDDWLISELNDNGVVSLQPLVSPEWSEEMDSLSDGEVSVSGSVDYQNYRPPEDDRHIPEYLEGSADMPEGSDDEDGGSGEEPEVTATTTTITHAPSSQITSQCASHLKAGVKLCVDLALNVERLVLEMGRLVVHTGYYNVSLDNTYLSHLYRECMGGVPMAAWCVRDAGYVGVVERAYSFVDTHVDRRYGTHTHALVHGARESTCFMTHLMFLKTCLASDVTKKQLEGLVKAVILKDKGAVAVCQELNEVQQCFLTSLVKCDDDISLVLVDQMFEVTKRDVTCVVSDAPISDVDTVKSMGTVILLVLSILTAKLF